jgi:hypothetical protein
MAVAGGVLAHTQVVASVFFDHGILHALMRFASKNSSIAAMTAENPSVKMPRITLMVPSPLVIWIR